MFSSVFAFNPAVDDNASNVMINEPGLMAAMFNNDPTPFRPEHRFHSRQQ
jgi:hypothetical protein